MADTFESIIAGSENITEFTTALEAAENLGDAGLEDVARLRLELSAAAVTTVASITPIGRAVGKGSFVKANFAKVDDYIDLEKFSKQVKRTDFQGKNNNYVQDPSSGFYIQANQGKPHGGSTYKLFNRLGARVGSVNADGKITR